MSNFFIKDPITSYGVILYYIDEYKNLWYLLAQRRDTIEYADYIRGRYSFANLETYFGLMTQEERQRLARYHFDDLWDDLWVDHSNKYYKESYAKAKAKFYANVDLMKSLLENTQSDVTEPAWGFPKGKMNYGESEVECAFREFKEETGLDINYLNLINMSPSQETFKGTNDKMYSTIYYIAQATEKTDIKKVYIPNSIREYTVSDEISNLRWCRVNEAMSLLVPHRQELILKTEEKILKYIVK